MNKRHLNLFKEKNKEYTWQTQINEFNGFYYTTDRISAARVKKFGSLKLNNKHNPLVCNLQTIETSFEKGEYLGVLEIKLFGTEEINNRDFISINDYVFATHLLDRLVKINEDCKVYRSRYSSNFLIFDFCTIEILLCKTVTQNIYLNFKLKNDL